MKGLAHPLRATTDMVISNSNAMAIPDVRTISLPLPSLHFRPSQVPTALHFAYRLLHRAARPKYSLPSSPQSSLEGVVQEGPTPNPLMEKLISEIREELASFELRDMKSRETMDEALLLVDLIQRLGIQRHFDHLTSGILHSTYREWTDESGFASPGMTVLAFRLLRLNGYHVSADVIETLKDTNGGFSCFSIETPAGVSEILNLYRCSQTAFPFESDIMDQASQFARAQLNKVLSLGKWDPRLSTNNMRMEIAFALEYPRQCLLQRLESRNIIKQLWPGDGTINKCLALAKVDMEMLQMLHQQEIEEAKRWWAKLEVGKLPFAERAERGIAQCHFSTSATLFEPQYSAFRLIFVKICCLVVLLDDLVDGQHSPQLQELNIFSEAIQRWDPSMLDGLPLLKAVYRAIYNTMVEVAEDASKVQGHNLLPFFKNLWEELVAAFVKEAEWKISQRIPTFEDYLKVARITYGGPIITLTSVFSMGESITARAVQCISKDSRLMCLVFVIARLSNDIVTFKREEREGEMASSVSCYMRDNPHCTQEETIAFLRCFIESACREVEWEHFQSRELLPECCSRAVLTLATSTSLVYKKADAYCTTCDEEYMMLLRDYLYEPLVTVQNQS